MNDKYAATWVSHSSISDYLKCPRAYYLNNVYKDPKTGHKISIINPSLALGQIVHEVLESLSNIPTKDRFAETLTEKFHKTWTKISGEKGGFTDIKTENQYKQKGLEMIKRVQNNPGPLANLSIKIQMELPHYWLSEEDEIILCGKLDWIEFLKDTNSVHIIDFKTGKNKEDKDSLQLPIYHLLANNCQSRKVEKASYWYLNYSNYPEEKKLPNLKESEEQILKIAKKIKTARKLNHFKCPNGEKGCYACRPLEQIYNRKAKFVGTNDYGQDMYIINDNQKKDASIIL